MAVSDKHVFEMIVVLAANADEAMYVDGKLVYSSTTIYAGDIAEHSGGRPIVFRQVILADEFDGGNSVEDPTDWPENYEDLIPYIEAD